MNERNMIRNSYPVDFETGQQAQSHLHPEPCLLLAGTTSSHRCGGELEHRNLLGYRDGPVHYGMTQYAEPHPLTNLELGVPGILAGSNFYGPHLNLPCHRTFPVHVNNVSIGQFPSSSNYTANAIPIDDYVRDNFAMDGLRGSYKRKNAEAITWNTHNCNMSAGPSSSTSSVAGLPFDSRVSVMDASYVVPEYRANCPLPGAQDNGRSRAVAAGLHIDSARTHNYNHLAQSNFTGQPFQPSRGTMWMDQQSINNSGGGAALPWNMIPVIPCFPGSSVHGASLEIANVGPHGYHEPAAYRGPENFLQSAPVVNHAHNFHPAPCIHGIGGFPITYQPLVAATPAGHPLNNTMQRTSLGSSAMDVESLPPTSSFRMNLSNRRGVLPDAVSTHRNVPYMSVLPTDEVAILGIPHVYEAGDTIDHHRDMRLDIDDMSYEELLALSERIGNVNTGLSEKVIADHLKTRSHSSFAANINLEELPSADQKVETCIICQDEYKEKDRIGTLDCGHEYHEECLKKWLYLKNVCPICKSTALAVQHKDG